MVLSCETCEGFGCMASFLSRCQGMAELRDVPRDPVTCQPGEQMASSISVDRETPPEIDINTPPRLLQKMDTQTTHQHQLAKEKMTIAQEALTNTKKYEKEQEKEGMSTEPGVEAYMAESNEAWIKGKVWLQDNDDTSLARGCRTNTDFFTCNEWSAL